MLRYVAMRATLVTLSVALAVGVAATSAHADETVTYDVEASANDGTLTQTGASTFTFSATSSLQVGDESSVLYDKRFFVRFPGVLLDPGEQVTEAHVQLIAGANSTGTRNVVVHVVDESNCAAPTDVATFNAKPLMSWAAPATPVTVSVPALTIFSTQASLDVTAGLQLVTQKSAWARGNAVCVVVKPSVTGYGGSTTDVVQFLSWDSTPLLAELLITTAPADGEAVQLVRLVQEGSDDPFALQSLYSDFLVVSVVLLFGAGVGLALRFRKGS